MNDRDRAADVAFAVASTSESTRTTVMSLTDYEHTKLSIAELLRKAMDSIAPTDSRREECLTLFRRLADDRFNLVVAGRFNRGKSTLMNAILGMDRLPCGTLPLTSVITDVVYGTTESVRIEMRHGGLPIRLPMDQLTNYLTEHGNPGNSQGVRVARVELPAEILRRGFHLIDTPGLGSSIRENSATTMEFMPEADALVLVTGFDSPLGDEELRVLETVAGIGLPVFVVMNKQDLVTPAARADAVQFVTAELRRHFRQASPPIFPLSARDGLTAKLQGNADALLSTGLPSFEDAITRFLIDHKNRRFLLRLIDLVQEFIERAVPPDMRTPLRRTLDTLRTHPLTPDATLAAASDDPIQSRLPQMPPQPRYRHCEICTRINTAFFDFLRQLQHSLLIDPEALREFVTCGGFCPQHLWMYNSIAAPRDLCVILAPVIRRRIEKWERLMKTRRHDDGTIRLTHPRIHQCSLCALQGQIERDAICHISKNNIDDSGWSTWMPPALCEPHMVMIARRQDAADRVRSIYAAQIRAAVRLTEDMGRYALKRDALREALTSEEERNAARDAVELLAGRRSINV